MSFRNKIVFDDSHEDTYCVSLADFDNDGWLDIVIGNSSAPNFVYLNRNEAREWFKIKLKDVNFTTYDITVGDLNGDGRVDIIESNSDERNIYYFNILKE
jgi:hypothetical protein